MNIGIIHYKGISVVHANVISVRIGFWCIRKMKNNSYLFLCGPEIIATF